MKTKKINKTLSLSKRTIANLNGNEMKAVKGGTGGYTGSFIICPTDSRDSNCDTCAPACDTESICAFCTNTLLC